MLTKNLVWHSAEGEGIFPYTAQKFLWAPSCLQAVLLPILFCQVSGAGTEPKQMGIH